MSEPTSANTPKPSSSVKLVLLGEAAVGKVSTYLLSLSYSLCSVAPGQRIWANSFGWLVDIVIAGIAICQQRLPGEQRAYYWR